MHICGGREIYLELGSEGSIGLPLLESHSTRAKVNQVYGSTEEKEEGEVHKVLGPPLRGGQR